MTTPHGFDELIHPPTRLALMSMLAATEWAEFVLLRDTLKLSDSALSKQVSTLVDAGYARIEKHGAGRRRRTLVSLTPEGRAAFDGHVAALQALVNQAPLTRSED
ncbi:winged helix-turn-helix domain-containing protein [Phytomonospora endophytica]|uniref:DNA-binding MarR family transcriptional regulator n=1 Tax=Phytomonospora endophytica TaxID=714109 RepID=A0A841FQU2_9ACTN|nr:transcriptional regulator [Phytomonospora endophytica]MBB6036158.1 DNA-binding MarR family transcriptional regulator [Phytomonospora endophytica]GIG67061.1 MarR family transcriptional regulator [Phytomonospora endophytica]